MDLGFRVLGKVWQEASMWEHWRDRRWAKPEIAGCPGEGREVAEPEGAGSRRNSRQELPRPQEERDGPLLLPCHLLLIAT